MEPSGTNTRKDFHKKLYERALSGDSEDTKGVFWSCLSGEECRVLVVVAMRVHLLPFRTQKLSSSALMIVGLNSRKSKSPPRPCISQEEVTKTTCEGCFFVFLSFFLLLLLLTLDKGDLCSPLLTVEGRFCLCYFVQTRASVSKHKHRYIFVPPLLTLPNALVPSLQFFSLSATLFEIFILLLCIWLINLKQ